MIPYIANKMREMQGYALHPRMLKNFFLLLMIKCEKKCFSTNL